MKPPKLFIFILFFFPTVKGVFGQVATLSPPNSPVELSKKLANPVAYLVSVPLQNNTDYGIGPKNGSKNTMNLQPVIPLSISRKLNMIARIIVPVVTQSNMLAKETKQSWF